MAIGINIGVYKPIISMRQAWSFDLGAALMRIYTFMVTIGSVSMLTLAGNSVLLSGSVSSCIALATFLISPRVSKRIDEQGQSAVIPAATVIALAGLLLMLAVTTFALPFWLNYPAALAMGFVPNAQAIARSRWTYLVKSQGQKHGVSNVDIKTVFSYEGIIDDMSFMIGPSAAVALSAGLFPAAGLGFGGICYAVGVALLLSSKSTEPVPGWADGPAFEGEAAPAGLEVDGEADPAAEGTFSFNASDRSSRSLLVISPQVRVLFFLMFGLGALYGVLDTSTVTFGQDLGVPVISSIALVVQALISLVSGAIFGAVKIKKPLLHQWLATCCLIGGSYLLLLVVRGTLTFFIAICVGALFYAPFLITLNTACERSVENSRLTEGITWISSGMTFGLAVGPTIAGIFIDAFGSIAGFNAAAGFGAFIVAVALVCVPVMRRTLS